VQLLRLEAEGPSRRLVVAQHALHPRRIEVHVLARRPTVAHRPRLARTLQVVQERALRPRGVPLVAVTLPRLATGTLFAALHEEPRLDGEHGRWIADHSLEEELLDEDRAHREVERARGHVVDRLELPVLLGQHQVATLGGPVAPQGRVDGEGHGARDQSLTRDVLVAARRREGLREIRIVVRGDRAAASAPEVAQARGQDGAAIEATKLDGPPTSGALHPTDVDVVVPVDAEGEGRGPLSGSGRSTEHLPALPALTRHE